MTRKRTKSIDIAAFLKAKKRTRTELLAAFPSSSTMLRNIMLILVECGVVEDPKRTNAMIAFIKSKKRSREELRAKFPKKKATISVIAPLLEELDILTPSQESVLLRQNAEQTLLIVEMRTQMKQLQQEIAAMKKAVATVKVVDTSPSTTTRTRIAGSNILDDAHTLPTVIRRRPVATI